jgi:hypothetical protein
MKPCPYCRLVPGALGVGLFGNGRTMSSWACESCQAGVDRALASMAVLRAVQRGAVHPGILTTQVR